MHIFPVGTLIPVLINTEKADGTPITFSGSPALGVRKGIASAVTTGLGTLTIDAGGLTGAHTIEIDTSAGEGYYEAGNVYYLVATAGTIDGVSAVAKAFFVFMLGPVEADVQAWDGGAAPSLDPLASISDILEDTGTTLPAAIALLATAAALSTLDGKVDGLNDLSAAEVDAALEDYDGPTKAELDSGLSGLSIPSVAEINTKLETEHGAGSWGAQGSYTITPTTPLTNSETGAAIPGMIVKIYSDSARTEIITQETSDTDGSFTAHVTASGTYYLRATKEGYQDLEWAEVAS